VNDCVSERIKTFVSFVVNFADGEVRTKSPEEYTEFARLRFGLRPESVIIRDYMASEGE
jgi:hypothetical protein